MVSALGLSFDDHDLEAPIWRIARGVIQRPFWVLYGSSEAWVRAGVTRASHNENCGRSDTCRAVKQGRATCRGSAHHEWFPRWLVSTGSGRRVTHPCLYPAIAKKLKCWFNTGIPDDQTSPEKAEQESVSTANSLSVVSSGFWQIIQANTHLEYLHIMHMLSNMNGMYMILYGGFSK